MANENLATAFWSSGLRGAGTGGATGAMVGSVIPVVGTVAGAGIGAAIGLIGGGLIGRKAEKDRLEAVRKAKKAAKVQADRQAAATQHAAKEATATSGKSSVVQPPDVMAVAAGSGGTFDRWHDATFG